MKFKTLCLSSMLILSPLVLISGCATPDGKHRSPFTKQPIIVVEEGNNGFFNNNCGFFWSGGCGYFNGGNDGPGIGNLPIAPPSVGAGPAAVGIS